MTLVATPAINLPGYRMGPVLANGASTSSVISAIDEATGSEVACKVFSKSHATKSQEAIVESATTEAHTLQQLRHPNIAAFKELAHTESEVVIVMERVQGRDLMESLSSVQNWGNSAQLREEAARAPLRQLAQALAYLHDKSYMHGDVKPENVVVQPSGQLKLVDFGLARFVASGPEQQRRRNSRGSPCYAAPEVLQGAASVGLSADMWSLGATLLEAVTGRIPFSDAHSIADLVRRTNRADFTPLDLHPGLQQHYSSELQNLLKGLMHPDDRCRMNVLSVLAHPWFNTVHYPCQCQSPLASMAGLYALTAHDPDEDEDEEDADDVYGWYAGSSPEASTSLTAPSRTVLPTLASVCG